MADGSRLSSRRVTHAQRHVSINAIPNRQTGIYGPQRDVLARPPLGRNIPHNSPLDIHLAKRVGYKTQRGRERLFRGKWNAVR
jgi:hypothetical protein